MLFIRFFFGGAFFSLLMFIPPPLLCCRIVQMVLLFNCLFGLESGYHRRRADHYGSVIICTLWDHIS